MGRKRGISGLLLIVAVTTACSTGKDMKTIAEENACAVEIRSGCAFAYSKADTPEDCKIHDLNLLVFENGILDQKTWIQGTSGSAHTQTLNLYKDHIYSFFAAANFGEELNISRWDELQSLYYEIKDKSGFREGIPMTAFYEDIMIDGQTDISLELIRMAAKVSLKMNRGRLPKDVEMEVRRVCIGNYPKYCNVIGKNKAANAYDCFEKGFEMDEQNCRPLNISGKGGLSEEISLYLLENMQGSFPYDIGEDEEKIFDDDDPWADRCSYIELELFYRSDELISHDSNLIYRFYIGEGLTDLDIERNCHYHITVIPEDDGLSGSGWRVDKSGIGPSVPYFEILPGEHIEGCAGDEINIRCNFYPRSAPFEIGYDELNYDKGKGLYDYTVDEDGYGVTLYLKNPGSGLVRMAAGDPINQSGIVLIKVNP